MRKNPGRKQRRNDQHKDGEGPGISWNNLHFTAGAIASSRTLNPSVVTEAKKIKVLSAHEKHVKYQKEHTK